MDFEKPKKGEVDPGEIDKIIEKILSFEDPMDGAVYLNRFRERDEDMGTNVVEAVNEELKKTVQGRAWLQRVKDIQSDDSWT